MILFNPPKGINCVLPGEVVGFRIVTRDCFNPPKGISCVLP